MDSVAYRGGRGSVFSPTSRVAASFLAASSYENLTTRIRRGPELVAVRVRRRSGGPEQVKTYPSDTWDLEHGEPPRRALIEKHDESTIADCHRHRQLTMCSQLRRIVARTPDFRNNGAERTHEEPATLSAWN